ncbi:MAG: hypothetical protein KatS3mg061_1189 [Dehalococcoidia bacterium]|nr:MAG: hypothetical protein KatS3mg061_1189 [Dehalococcoidia bacterium]
MRRKDFSTTRAAARTARANRKARIAAQQASSGGAHLGAAGNGRREYTRATCAACGGEALVPFLPRGDRPVYCSDCFDKVRSYR